ncbi:MAG: AMP-binding protein [Paracoccaceae bacterium]
MKEASGRSISEKAIVFQWHPAARVFDGAGQEYYPAGSGASVTGERPAGVAIGQAIAAGSFRIGGDGPGPVAGFETLTSGSSGVARRVGRSCASWVASFTVNAGMFGIGPGVRVAALGRLSQSLAVYGALEAVYLGASLHLLDEVRPDRQRRILAERGVQVLYATPAQMRLMVEAGGAVLSDLRLVVIGGSKLDLGLRAGLRAMAPTAQMREFYGAAEASFITIADGDTPEDSVGRAYPGVELRVDGGEIWVRSPYLFDGYAGDDPGSARWQGGWLSVGEMGYLRDGHLYLSGRAGRMVTVADQNVFPEEIEACLQGLGGVQRVAVLPVPDELRGHHLVAIVMGDARQEAAILAAARVKLGPLKAPKRLIWRGDWPVLTSGKTDLVTLARELAAWR